jgi:hypothetical protein
MTDSKDIQKLRALLPHWIQHNTEHGDEFRAWAHRVEEVATQLNAAAQHFDEASFILKTALEQLGGPSEDEHRHERKSS